MGDDDAVELLGQRAVGRAHVRLDVSHWNPCLGTGGRLCKRRVASGAGRLLEAALAAMRLP